MDIMSNLQRLTNMSYGIKCYLRSKGLVLT